MKPESTSTILHLAGKMKRPTTPSGVRAQRRMRSLKRSILFGAIFVLIVTTAFYTASSASSSSRSLSRGSLPSSASQIQRSNKTRAGSDNKTGLLGKRLINSRELFALLAPQASPAETIDTYAADCTTPKDVFNLGDTVCAKVTGAPLRAEAPLRRINWSDPNGNVGQTLDVTSDPQTNLFVIPASGTSFVDGVTIDNRGTWAASINSTSDSSTRAIAYFNVKDPANAAADLAIYNFSTSAADPVAPGANTGSFLWITNNGPDVAQNVHVTQSTPPNLTYVSVAQDSGPALTCTNSAGVTDCEISNLAVGAVATLTINYSATGSSGFVTTRANITSDTTDSHPDNNSSDAGVEIRAAGAPPATCSLGCPSNMTVTANTTDNGQPDGNRGAIVTYTGSVEVSGECGTTIRTPASGTFFPVGTTQVSVTSSQGGGSCSFTVTVIDSAPPTIECPANLGVTAPAGDCNATVDPGTPTATGDGVTVSGVRSDGEALNAPYPAGITTITWTATDSNDRTATCQQTITVTTNDTTPPTITAPPDVNIATPSGTSGSCGLVVGETELGTPNASDNCTVNVIRTGVPAGNFFPVGTTVVTYTARDGAGNTATATQNVTVTEATPPIIAAPPDASYTCVSEVPAADPSQATGGQTFDANGNPLPLGPPTDNCGTPTVTVSETRTGAGSASSPLIITRTFTATDAAHNTASAVQTITVIDSTPPTIQAPPDVSVNTGSGAASCDAVVSNATLGTATANDNCQVTVTRSPSGNTFPVGTTNVIWTATDAAGNTATATQHVTVTDNTAPIIAAPADKTLYTGAGATSCDVTVGNLDATLGTATASDNCGSVTVVRGGSNVFPLGDTLVTYTATDSHGNTATATQKVTVVDNTPPVVTPPANITVQLPLNSTATSMTVSYPNPATATDNCAGTITFSYSPASGSTFNVGPTTVTVTATDAHGNSASATFTVTVLYNFTGFFSPVANLPTLNVVNAGRAIPVKFSLSGNKGLSIFAANNPYSIAINCDTTAPAADVTETLTAGGSSLSYSPDQYNYVWKTESSWAGTCRQLTVTLNDGSVHTANFKFK